MASQAGAPLLRALLAPLLDAAARCCASAPAQQHAQLPLERPAETLAQPLAQPRTGFVVEDQTDPQAGADAEPGGVLRALQLADAVMRLASGGAAAVAAVGGIGALRALQSGEPDMQLRAWAREVLQAEGGAAAGSEGLPYGGRHAEMHGAAR